MSAEEMIETLNVCITKPKEDEKNQDTTKPNTAQDVMPMVNEFKTLDDLDDRSNHLSNNMGFNE